MKAQKGFTLIEIAIVLVIIGLLLGGVLKGQELITSARVRNLISQQDGIKAAFFGFQDRYRAAPGDYSSATTNINCASCINGNGNGRVDDDVPTSRFESLYAWHHMNAAGFLNGSYVTGATDTGPTDANSPKNPYGIHLQLIYDGIFGVLGTGSAPRHNIKSGSQIPVEILAEVDRKIDDGLPSQGSFQLSVYVGLGGAITPANCVKPAATPPTTPTDIYQITTGETNCGGASVL